MMGIALVIALTLIVVSSALYMMVKRLLWVSTATRAASSASRPSLSSVNAGSFARRSAASRSASAPPEIPPDVAPVANALRA